MTPPWGARIVDALLEGSVVGSFSRVGYDVRSRLEHWSPPASMAGRTVVITGATSGLGYETAGTLAALGAEVLFVARNQERAERTRTALRQRAGHDRIDFVLADMASLASVRAAAAALADRLDSLDVLIHNAGALSDQRTVTSEGNETTVAAQLLGPHLLTRLLLAPLTKAAPGRVLTVSSGGLYSAVFDLATLEMSDADYDGVKAYARVKRAQLVLNKEWSRRVDPDDVTFAVMHPGWTDTPGLAASLPSFYRFIRRWLRTPAQGADTLVWLATTPQPVRPSGVFWFDRRRRSQHKVPWTRSANPAADQLALWQWCEERTAD